MPSKRKIADTQPPSPPPEAPRRSRRIKVENAPTEDGLIIGASCSAANTKNGVDRVMQELSEMEQKLQNAVRSQRLAIESSDLGCEDQETTHEMVEEQPLKASKAIINEKSKNDVPTEQAPLGGYEADLAVGDMKQAGIDEEETSDRGARRPPPVNSTTLPLPWTGRLGYACLNTYLRTSNPAVFSSRTCRMASIIEHRHPLTDPSQPEHSTKNRPDKTMPADISRGLKYVQELGIANAKDIVKMIRWNHKYGINFMRLSSEMFPFASHEEHGYKLAPFASEVLAEAGKVAGELNHRLTTHPGQFTQIGSPRKEVVAAAIRDLEYHDEMLSLLKLPEQMNRDAVMILHMGGTYGDKAATLDRFRENYKKLSDGVKNRLVLENDDVAWSLHDLLPICEELNIPFVLDFHHHNIIFDPSIREGTQDVIDFYDRIKKTWTRKNIRQKMHYSEQTAPAITPRDRRKHSARVKTLPPCPPDMDLMIEAKDKEQAVFELMRTFKLPGCNLFNDVVPYERDDESRNEVKRKKKKTKAKTKTKANTKPKRKSNVTVSTNGAEEDGEADGGIDGNVEEDDANEEDDILVPERIVSADDFGMGGPENRVYWPEGMEEWLRPKKRETKKDKADKADTAGAD